jgi:hypothetical protein
MEAEPVVDDEFLIYVLIPLMIVWELFLLWS